MLNICKWQPYLIMMFDRWDCDPSTSCGYGASGSNGKYCQTQTLSFVSLNIFKTIEINGISIKLFFLHETFQWLQPWHHNRDGWASWAQAVSLVVLFAKLNNTGFLGLILFSILSSWIFLSNRSFYHQKFHNAGNNIYTIIWLNIKEGTHFK